MQRHAKRVICRKKRNYERAELQDLEKLRSRNEVRKFYQKLKGQSKGSNESQTAVCYITTGCLLANPEDVTKRWVEYFNELLNGNDTVMTRSNPSDKETQKQQESRFRWHTCGILKSRRRCSCWASAYSSTENLDRRTTASGMEYKRQGRRCKSLFEL